MSSGVAVPHYLRRIPLALEMPSQGGEQEDGVSCSAAPQYSAKSASVQTIRERNPGRRAGQTGAPGGGALKARPVPETSRTSGPGNSQAVPSVLGVPGVGESIVRQQPLQAHKIAAKGLPDLIPSLHALRIGWSEFSKTVVGHRQG